MKSSKKKYSLLAPEAIGGYIAESGFQYQASLIAAKVPIWLNQDGFTEVIRESLGDVEAKFFIPEFGLTSEFIEYKNHRLTPSEFWPEIEHFRALDITGAYHKFTLACTGVSDDLTVMINALNRLRGAYSFYANALVIQNESFNDFALTVSRLGNSKELADFLFSKVWFEIDLVDAESYQRELFRESLLSVFPIFNELQARDSTSAYQNIVDLLSSKKGKPITRNELEKSIWTHIDLKYHPISKIRFLIRNDLSSLTTDGSIIFHWEKFAGGSERKFPHQSEWNEILLKQLVETKHWLLSNSQTRRIDINGYRRISASIAIGSVFSSTLGFVVATQTKDGIWITNNYPTPNTPEYLWDQSFYVGEKKSELAVGVSIITDLETEVESYLNSEKFEGNRYYSRGQAALVSDQQINLAVNQLKKNIIQMIAEGDVKKIYLFLAGPSQFALFLGHRLNTSCDIQCYERQTPNVYIPTILIPKS